MRAVFYYNAQPCLGEPKKVNVLRTGERPARMARPNRSAKDGCEHKSYVR
jgi:hypothetical protein